MWQLRNCTPFAAEQGWIRDRDGAEVWLVVVKATFDIQLDGSTTVSKIQPGPLRVPEYHGEPGKSSVRHESDFVLTKKTTDVLVLGHAHSPGGRAVRELDAGFRIGTLQKLVRVFGERHWGYLGPGDPEPFTSMPLLYERAFGGIDNDSAHPETDWDWRNPVGCGFVVKASHLQGTPVPNLEIPNRLIRAWDDRPPPAGFGPIASHWQPRASFAGTYGPRWEATRQPLLPDDFDDLFFQCAPADQQTPVFLEGGEQVTLLNLSPHGSLSFSLPQVRLALQTQFMDGERRPHQAPNLHTVLLEPDRPSVSLVWHSALECHAKVYQLESTRIDWQTGVADEDGDESVENLLDLV